jgi:hypothetical protein
VVKRHQHVEHAILTLVLTHGDHQGYAPTLPTLAAILRQSIPDISDREIVDTIKRLSPQYLTLSKYSPAHRGLVRYPEEIGDDGEFFYRADFCMQRTPHTDPYLQTLALEVSPPEVLPAMTPSIDEAGRQARFARWEQMGLDRVKADLVQTGGIREVGGSLDVRELAWEWVRMKEAEAQAAANQKPRAADFKLIAAMRLEELRTLTCGRHDFKKLLRLCEEINITYDQECYFATAMLTRAILDHVPPVFGFKTFSEVANNYSGGGKSFKEAMQHLENASRRVADAHLHMPIRSSETLPSPQQVNCGQQLDILLAEIVRTAR